MRSYFRTVSSGSFLVVLGLGVFIDELRCEAAANLIAGETRSSRTRRTRVSSTEETWHMHNSIHLCFKISQWWWVALCNGSRLIFDFGVKRLLCSGVLSFLPSQTLHPNQPDKWELWNEVHCCWTAGCSWSLERRCSPSASPRRRQTRTSKLSRGLRIRG